MLAEAFAMNAVRHIGTSGSGGLGVVFAINDFFRSLHICGWSVVVTVCHPMWRLIN